MGQLPTTSIRIMRSGSTMRRLCRLTRGDRRNPSIRRRRNGLLGQFKLIEAFREQLVQISFAREPAC
jgi:hypothetical protein